MRRFAVYNWLFCAIAITLPLAAQNPTTPPQNTPPSPHIDWKQGPFTAKLGDEAEIAIPKDYLFSDGDGARKYLEFAHNPVSKKELGILTPKAQNEDWVVIFEFDDVGFVKDDDKGKLDAPAILESLKNGTEEANEIRKQRGWPAFHVVGWRTEPFYDQTTHNLTWAINGQEDNETEQTINHSVRILGRRGTMNVDLIVDPKEFTQTVPVFNAVMTGFKFTGGSRYADFTSGDKLAGYGLTALVVGGAGTIAAKTGLLAKFWKVIVGLFAALWKIFAVIVAGIVARFRQLAAWIKSKFSKPKSEVELLNEQNGIATNPFKNDHAGD